MLSKILQDPLSVKRLVENWDDDTTKTIMYHFAIRRCISIVRDRIKDGETWDSLWTDADIAGTASDYSSEFNFMCNDEHIMTELVRDHYQPELKIINEMIYANQNKEPTWTRLTKLD